MTIIQIWATISGLILIVLTVKTMRFTAAMEALKDIVYNNSKETLWPKISFIVPACNEELTIASAAESLLKIDYPNLEIVIVNDRSTDNTGKIADKFAAQDSRLKVLHIKELPQGWLGKVHAVNSGIEATTGDWILLADADIHFNSDALKKAITVSQERKLDFLTSVPDIKSRSPILQVLIAQLFHQGSLFFDLKKINNPKQRTCYGIGAFMLLRRSVYDRSERMEWLCMEAIDDTGLAVMMRRAGAKMGAIAGRGEIELEWYPSVMGYIKGVEKNAFAFCQYSWTILFGLCLTNWALVLGFTLAPFLSGNHTVQAFCVLATAAYLSSIHLQMKKLLELSFWQVCLFPFAVMALPIVFLRAATLAKFNKGIYWRGTFYSLAELKKNQRMKLANLIFSLDEESAGKSGDSSGSIDVTDTKFASAHEG